MRTQEASVFVCFYNTTLWSVRKCLFVSQNDSVIIDIIIRPSQAMNSIRIVCAPSNTRDTRCNIITHATYACIINATLMLLMNAFAWRFGPTHFNRSRHQSACWSACVACVASASPSKSKTRAYNNKYVCCARCESNDRELHTRTSHLHSTRMLAFYTYLYACVACLCWCDRVHALIFVIKSTAQARLNW